MKKGNNMIPLVEEAFSKSKQNNNDINKTRAEEDDKSTHSADYSGNDLKENQNQNILYKKNYPISLNKKQLEKYNEKLKEKTMRMEIDKRYTETERLKNKYEEKNSHLHTFDNNPQFQQMLRRVCKQLMLLFLLGIFYLFYNAIIYFNLSNKKEGLALIGSCLSISTIAFCVILLISLNIGLLNDPNLSKTFRLFILFEFMVLITTFVFNIILSILCNKYLKKKKQFKNKIVIYLIIASMILFTLLIIKSCLNLFIESILILFGKKTEYSILIINEQSLKKNEMNFNTNLSLTDNNVTNEALTNSTSLFNNEEEKEKDKEEEQYKAFNYYNKFHYSVTSARKNDYTSFKKN
jgi:uncharacterized membrane protein (DUF485 family)